MVAIMTRSVTMLHNTNQEAVFLAVDEHVAYFLHISRLFAFTPDAVARTAEEVSVPRFTRPLKGFFVHKGDHQDFSAMGILYYSGDEPLTIKFECWLH